MSPILTIKTYLEFPGSSIHYPLDRKTLKFKMKEIKFPLIF